MNAYNKPTLPTDPGDFWDQVIFYSVIAIVIIVGFVIVNKYL
jgi:hypothetical protein